MQNIFIWKVNCIFFVIYFFFLNGKSSVLSFLCSCVFFGGGPEKASKSKYLKIGCLCVIVLKVSTDEKHTVPWKISSYVGIYTVKKIYKHFQRFY